MTERALPAWAIDLIKEGIPKKKHDIYGHQAAYAALLRTSNSAVNHGMQRSTWIALIDSPGSQLGNQLKINAHGRQRPTEWVTRDLVRAWDNSTEYVAQNPALTRDHYLSEIERCADELVQLSQRENHGLLDVDLALLDHAINEARRLGTTRPTLPRKTAVEKTGFGQKSIRNSFERLHKLGLLKKEVQGRSGSTTAGSRVASAYRLPAPEALAASYIPQERVCGPPPPTEPAHGYVGPPPPPDPLGPPLVLGPPTPDTPPPPAPAAPDEQEEPTVAASVAPIHPRLSITPDGITITAKTADEFAGLLAQMRRVFDAAETQLTDVGRELAAGDGTDAKVIELRPAADQGAPHG